MKLTINEKRLLSVIKEINQPIIPIQEIAKRLDTSIDSAVQWTHLCVNRGYLILNKQVNQIATLTEEGKKYAVNGLPERQILNSIDKPTQISEISKNPLSKIAIGWLRKKNWITIENGLIIAKKDIPMGNDELALKNLDVNHPGCKDLIKRELVTIKESIEWTVSLTPNGLSAIDTELDLREEIGTLSSDQIRSGSWKNLPLREYSIDKLPKPVYAGRIHPHQQIIDEIRSLLFEMGFEEFYGSIVQNAFWNFDALYQPQDHPAREMQDTFHLAESIELPDGWEKIRDIHVTGGNTGSSGWGGNWSPDIAKKCVLRTHSTSLSIQHLAKNPNPPIKAFSVSRVYRRETIDPTHLPEFEQLEGIVMDNNLNFGHLLGFFKEFFGRLGFDSVRFRPGYFPYTEPSVEPEVWVDGLGWMELGGAGIFRREVTDPWQIKYNVLAWGLGISRVSMLRLGLKDLRQLYRSNIDWIRSSPLRRC